MRVRTLWRVPVFCLLASAVSYWLTIFPGYLFYVNRVANADGSIEVSVDPPRGTLFKIALFLLVLLLGGLWAFRSMSRREIACSAALLILPMLAIVLAQLFLPGFPLKVSGLLVSVLQLERQPFLPLDAVLPPSARCNHHRPVRAAAVRPLWAAAGLTFFL